MRVYKKLFEVCQKYDPYKLIVHFEIDGINYVYQASSCLTLRICNNDDVERIQKKGRYRHVYMRKEEYC